MEVKDLPLIVVIDCQGNNLYESEKRKSIDLASRTMNPKIKENC